MKRTLKRLIKDETAATAIEMGLICSLIALAAMGAMQGLGNMTGQTWNKVQNSSDEAIQKTNSG